MGVPPILIQLSVVLNFLEEILKSIINEIQSQSKVQIQTQIPIHTTNNDDEKQKQNIFLHTK